MPEATILTGMRRTGKTAILQKLFADIKTDHKVYLDLENRINREIFLNLDYEDIWLNLKKTYGLNDKKRSFIFLDEIQYIKELPSIMKYLFDHHAVKFIVTGSSSFYLKNLFTESLSGRKQLFELFPLTFDEFLVFKGKAKTIKYGESSLPELKKSDSWQKVNTSLFEEYLHFGGFPGVVLAESFSHKINLLKDILYSYIDHDVRNLSSFKKIIELEHLIKLLSARIGQKLDVAKVSLELSLSRQTILEYLGFLEKTYILFLIRPFSKSPDREISKTPKIYFCDTGFANILAQISSGQILENQVFHNLKVKYAPNHPFNKIHYYQKKSGMEIDFILNQETAIEVKETADNRDLKRLASLSRQIGIKKSILISKNLTSVPEVIYASQL